MICHKYQLPRSHLGRMQLLYNSVFILTLWINDEFRAKLVKADISENTEMLHMSVQLFYILVIFYI